LISTYDIAQVTTACLSPLADRHARCSGRLMSLVPELNGTECLCSHHDTDEPTEEDGGLDLYVDLMVERDLEDAHFTEGWS